MTSTWPRRKAPSGAWVRLCVLVALAWAAPRTTAAQTPVTVSLDTVFFADNTEFFSPYRIGETILGTWQRLNTDITLSDRASLRLGLFALERDGSQRRTELARPVASLTMGTPAHRFTIGTLETGARVAGAGPDRTTPHGLLPPLATETLWFSRAYEAGLQWRINTERFAQDVWFDYQQVITPDQRELFDAGIVGRWQHAPEAAVALLYQWQVVHHGGQQFHTGAVSDSFGWGPGVRLRRAVPAMGVASVETYALFSYDQPDRAHKELNVQGKAAFIRAAVERGTWRAHGIVWRANDFKHESGDPNYLSTQLDGSAFAGTRRYLELGLSRQFAPARLLDFEVSARAHRVQSQWDYSYRLLGTLHVNIWHTTIDPN